MSDLYTGTGNKITVGGGGGEVTPEAVKDALVDAIAAGDVNLGGVVGATLAHSMDQTPLWTEGGSKAYQKLLEAYRKIPQVGVPFFISTDQHGRGVEQHRWLNNTDVDGMEMANLNLGDTNSDYYETAVLNRLYDRTWQVKNYISVPGNHDYKPYHDPIDQLTMCRGFQCTALHRRADNVLDCYSAVDNCRMVKYIMCDFYDQAGRGTMAYTHVTGSVADWLIKELSADDGYDVIVCTHEPFFETCQHRGDSAEAKNTVQTTPALRKLMVDRKKKASGTYRDDDGGAHSYDFTGCKKDLLCTLHGHEHVELYSQADGLTTYAADWFGNNWMCTFGLIDRAARTLTLWLFDASGTVQEPLALPI